MPSGDCPRVLIVEDHDLLAQSLRLALQAEGFVVEVAELVDCASVIGHVVADPPDAVLLDLDLGDGIGDTTDLIPRFRAAGSAVLVVTGVRDRLRLAAALEAGAVGYLGKDVGIETLRDSLRAVTCGREILDPAHRADLLVELQRARRERAELTAPFARLSPRENQVLAELADGRSVAAIAGGWVVSEATVRTQVRCLLSKLGVNSQVAAVAKARKAGWISGRVSDRVH